MSHDHARHHHADQAGAADEAALAEMLDLDAQVLSGYWSEVTASVLDQAAGRPVGRVLDLGSGTGNGTLALAGCFGAAEVIAVDQSAGMLARLDSKAAQAGLADKVRTVAADLDGAWPTVGTVDLAWMSNALHHLADPDQALTRLFGAIRPGGLLAVIEMTAPIGFLPDDVGLRRPGLTLRLQEAFSGHAAGSMPHLGADWGPRLAQAGFSSVRRQDFPIELSQPLPAAARRYAQLSLRRAMTHLGSLSGDDLATLAVLTADDGTDSVLRREDLAVYGTRTLWTADRP